MGAIVTADIMGWVDFGARELAFFAGFWFLLGALDDLAVDGLWWRKRAQRHDKAETASALEDAPIETTRFAVFVAAWQEAEVIGETLANMLRQWGDSQHHHDVQVFVGCYANDPETLRAAMAVQNDKAGGPGLKIIINHRDGPTSKAQCLNRLWHALRDEERHDGRAFDAVVLHDAEDVVHRDALSLYAEKLRHHDVVQIPVIPLIHRLSPFISGHYADEFAEAHGKAMVVRDDLNAGLPLAGVGCAISRDVLGQVAVRDGKGGHPFSEDSLTEDYELGLLLHQAGARSILARRRAASGEWIATRAYFPHRLSDAVRQKSRWIAGIALNGWDRLGWQGGIAEHWMRLRDRRTMLSALVLLAAYGTIALGGILAIAIWAGWHQPQPLAWPLQMLLLLNAVFLFWRMAMRVIFTGRIYGLGQGLLAIPRMVVANVITIMAARRAMVIYCKLLVGGPLLWDKTDHAMPIVSKSRMVDMVARVRR